MTCCTICATTDRAWEKDSVEIFRCCRIKFRLQPHRMALHVDGPFSGKTSRCARSATPRNRPPRIDAQTGIGYRDTLIASHDGAMAQCSRLATLNEAVTVQGYAQAEMILVDEAQFFDDLVSAVKRFLNNGKTVHVFGLDGDGKQRPFGSVVDLIPLADSVQKLLGLCQICGEPAPFTVTDALIPETQVLIGGNELYSAVCRRHMMEHSGAPSC